MGSVLLYNSTYLLADKKLKIASVVWKIQASEDWSLTLVIKPFNFCIAWYDLCCDLLAVMIFILVTYACTGHPGQNPSLSSFYL